MEDGIKKCFEVMYNGKSVLNDDVINISYDFSDNIILLYLSISDTENVE